MLAEEGGLVPPVAVSALTVGTGRAVVGRIAVALALAGCDDKDAKAVVMGLVNDFGYAPVDLGGLVSGGRMQQAGGPIAGHDWVVA